MVASPASSGVDASVGGTAHAPRADEPVACARPWKLEAEGGDSRVVVVCKNDVQRQSLDDAGEMARALFPALDPARDRVCECTRKMQAPPFVDLVFTAKPDEGRVTVQANADDDLDPTLGPAFIACIGTVAARFEPGPFSGCPEGGASLVYPVRLALEP
jgi:hypothetical protein